MEDQYGLADLRQLLSNITRPQPQHHQGLPLMNNFPENPQRNHHYYDMMAHEMLPVGGIIGNSLFHREVLESTADATMSALEAENIVVGGGDGRWPRQETLTLLEIRSCLDLKFKESIQKGPLWDEVSRMITEGLEVAHISKEELLSFIDSCVRNPYQADASSVLPAFVIYHVQAYAWSV